MGPTLRRSRRSTPKKKSDFSVGDIVEVERGNGFLRGRLAYLLTELESANPRWLVKFENQKEEQEVYEAKFRKRSECEEEYVKSTSSNSRCGRNHGHRNRDAKPSVKSSPTAGSSEEVEAAEDIIINNNSSNNNNNNSSSSSNVKKPHAKKVSMASPEGSPFQSDESSNVLKREKRVSAREQRSLRRQAKIEVAPPPRPKLQVSNPSNGTSNGNSNKRRGTSKCAGGAHDSKRSKTVVEHEEEEVVKVKLLTGTLYLYRGLHPRAEFIRRV